MGELYERVHPAARTRTGAVDQARRVRARYARRLLIPGNPPKEMKDGAHNRTRTSMDRVFRVLDRDGDGVLSKDELTLRLKDERSRRHRFQRSHRQGRIPRCFQRLRHCVGRPPSRRSARAKVFAVRTGSRRPPAMPSRCRSGSPRPTPTSRQADQLFEWRRAGKSIEAFTEMDLDGDGRDDEYLRYLKKIEAERPKTVTAPPVGKRPRTDFVPPIVSGRDCPRPLSFARSRNRLPMVYQRR